ncbi:MAG: hypothetical protein ACXVIY_03585 [Mucilaginibacter sp.]
MWLFGYLPKAVGKDISYSFVYKFSFVFSYALGNTNPVKRIFSFFPVILKIRVYGTTA